MISKTRGIALHYIKYGDSSIIATIYTECFGRQSYIIKGAFGKKSAIKANLFMPLNLLELEVYNKHGRDLNSIKEAANFPTFCDIHTNPYKNSIALFIAEILYRCLQEQESNKQLFEYMFNAFQILDNEVAEQSSNFHLVFLVQLLKFMGFFPLNNYSASKPTFDLLRGHFGNSLPENAMAANKELSAMLSGLLNCTFENASQQKFDRDVRYQLLEKITDYYAIHFPGMGKIKSLQILREVFD